MMGLALMGSKWPTPAGPGDFSPLGAFGVLAFYLCIGAFLCSFFWVSRAVSNLHRLGQPVRKSASPAASFILVLPHLNVFFSIFFLRLLSRYSHASNADIAEVQQTRHFVFARWVIISIGYYVAVLPTVFPLVHELYCGFLSERLVQLITPIYLLALLPVSAFCWVGIVNRITRLQETAFATEAEIVKPQCSNCGENVSSVAGFCPMCGGKLK